jgi:hypothetical protein
MDDTTPHPLVGDDDQTPHLLGGDDIIDRLTTLFFKMKDAGRPQDKNTIADAIQEIKKLLEQSNRWQATAAGLSQDISNAEDDIERLQEQVQSKSIELLIAQSENLGLYNDIKASTNETIIAEIEQLKQQVNHAHAILGSEAMIWLIGGSEHAGTWIGTLSPSVHSYWAEYGTVFRQPNRNPHE